MTWTRLSDDFSDELADAGVGRPARLFLIELMIYANRRLLDGRIPLSAIPRITDETDWEGDLQELEEAGRLEVVDGMVILDWTDQESAADVIKRQEANRERQRRYAKRSAAHRSGDHTLCDPRYCKGANALANASHNGSHNALANGSSNASPNATPDPSRPVPSRPVPSRRDRGQGQEAGHDSAGATSDPPLPTNRHTYRPGCCGLPPRNRVHLNDVDEPSAEEINRAVRGFA